MGHYHLGEAAASAQKTPLGISYVSTPTLERDGFHSLFAAYKGAFPAGTSVTTFRKAIVAANGVRDTVPAIEAWIFGLSKKRFPFDAKDNPGMNGGTKNVGWSHFAAGNRIMLPDLPRPGVTPPEPLPGPSLDRSDLKQPEQTAREEQTPWWQSPVVLGVGALALVAAFVAVSDDDAKE